MKPAPNHWPYNHRTLEQVWYDEARKQFLRMSVSERKGRTVKQWMKETPNDQ